MATEAPLDGNDATASTPPTDIVNAAQWASAINDADQGAFSGEDYVVSSTASKPSEKNRDAAAQSSTDVTDAQQAKAQSKPAPRIKRSTLVKRRIVTSVPVEIPPPNVQAGGSGVQQPAAVGDDDYDEEGTSEDDGTLYCLCKQPYGRRFMIECSKCEEWYHGKCVGVTKAMGRTYEEDDVDWYCPKCSEEISQARIQGAVAELNSEGDSDDEPLAQKLVNRRSSVKQPAAANAADSRAARASQRAQKAAASTDDTQRPADKPDSKPATPDAIAVKPEAEAGGKSAAARKPSVTSADRQRTRDSRVSSSGIKEKPAKGPKEEKQDTKASTQRTRDSRVSSSGVKEKPAKGPKEDAADTKSIKSTGSSSMGQKTVVFKTVSGLSQALLAKKDRRESSGSKPRRESLGGAVDKGSAQSSRRASAEHPPHHHHHRDGSHSAGGSERHGPSDGASPKPGTSSHNTSSPQPTPQRRDSEGKLDTAARRPSTASTPSSLARSESVTARDDPARQDEARQRVRDTVKAALEARLKGNAALAQDTDCGVLANEIEQALFDENNQEAGQKYKTKYRAIYFNLKDPRNNVLYKRVLTKEIDPKTLVNLSHEDLASKEMAAALDALKKEGVKMSILQDNMKIIKKTHKGEEVVSLEEEMREALPTVSASVDYLYESREPSPSPPPAATKPHQEGTTVVAEEVVIHMDDYDGADIASPTYEYQDEHDTEPAAPKKDEALYDVTEGPDAGMDDGAPAKPMPAAVSASPARTDSSYKPPSSASSLTAGGEGAARRSSQSQAHTYAWGGEVFLHGLDTFSVRAIKLTGSLDGLPKILPHQLNSDGRIRPEVVVNYVLKVKAESVNKDVTVLQLQPAGGDLNRDNYGNFFQYFFSKQRVAVVPNIRPPVKDCYLFPVSAHGPLPAFLLATDVKVHRTNCLMLVIVHDVVEGSRKRSEAGPAIPEYPAKRAAVESDKPYDPENYLTEKPYNPEEFLSEKPYNPEEFLKAEAGSAPAATLQDPQAAAPGSNPAAPSQPTDPAPQPANPPAGGSSQSLLETLSAYGFAPNAGVSPSHQPTPEAAASIHPITAGGTTASVPMELGTPPNAFKPPPLAPITANQQQAMHPMATAQPMAAPATAPMPPTGPPPPGLAALFGFLAANSAQVTGAGLAANPYMPPQMLQSQYAAGVLMGSQPPMNMPGFPAAPNSMPGHNMPPGGFMPMQPPGPHPPRPPM